MFLLQEKEEVNFGRQKEVDIAKAITIFAFAFVHVTIECVSKESLTSGRPYFFDTVWGGPLGAPFLMFSMGIGMIYTKDRSPKAFFKRGMNIFALGFLFNLCRYVIPDLIGYAITGEYEHFIANIPYQFFNNDIMQYAGLTFMLMAFLIWLNIPNIGILAIGLVMSVFATLVNGTDFNSDALNIFFGYFIGAEDAAGKVESYFTLFNWAIVVMAGYVFGQYLIRVKDKKKFYVTISPICVVAATIYMTCGITHRFGMFGEGEMVYYHIITPDVISTIISVIGMFGVYYALSFIIPNKVMDIITIISKNINAEYCIHWIFVSVITRVIVYCATGTQELPMWMILIISVFITIASIVIAYIWKSRRTIKR